MHIQYCFPTALFSTVNVEMAEKMLPITKKYLNDPNFTSDKIGYKTTYNPKSGLEKFEDMVQFRDYISELGQTFFEKIGYKMYRPNFYVSLFAIEMLENEGHDIHTHPNSILSGVMYLQVPNNSSSIIFHDPKPKSKFIEHRKDHITDANMSELKINPKQGLILIWESWLDHRIPRNRNINDGRISLVFNMW